MLVFIVPLQSPEVSTDWTHVCKLAQRTISSILNQTHPEFRLLLVCNKPPADLPMHPALSILRRDFPIPDSSDRENRMIDKWKKVRIGMVAARAFAPCHIMAVDADDLVSRNLAGFCAANPNGRGWIFDRGWMHDENSRWVFRRRSNFDAICGTSNILRMDLADLPTTEEGSDEDNMLLKFGHTQIRAGMAARGTPLAELPFYGAMYILHTGENYSGFSLRGWRSKKIMLQKLLNYRPITAALRPEFGLEPLSS